ncbi:hypothetical protein ATW55_14500 [Ferroacidibacillus organovorans]|uniref:Transglycosylase SLT domain-containing protein n=2 Tax=Ferroacidibacillus organovorans TaxID=1765683 RepID=A0A117SY15_9BACL|nr:hypothetical protein ATW55_14500 [Ferroacidibacillus organovorans]
MKRPTRLVLSWVLGALGGWGVAIVILLFLLLLMTLGALVSSQDNAVPFTSPATIEPIPPQLLQIYHAASAKYHVPWTILAGINRVETDFGRALSVSSAGAIGWMQFEPATWAAYSVDADGDGNADPYSPIDAIFTAAHYLAATGVTKHPDQAVLAYNHSTDYAREVLQLAVVYQAWNPLSPEWVWPVADRNDPILGVNGSDGQPESVQIRCSAGVSVRAIHTGTVTAATGTGVTLDIGNGLTVIEQGLRPDVSRGQVVDAGETLGTAATGGVSAALEEQGNPLSPTRANLAPTPPLVIAPPPSPAS